LNACLVPEILETECGPVEVARTGAGPPVVVVHGTPGGWDSSLAMGRFLADDGFEVIAPARPGYQETPLPGRETIDHQADLLAALLDALGHERAGVLAWSGGGPSAYRMAVRHPERVAALVGFAAVSEAYPKPQASLDERLMMESRAGNWLVRFLTAHQPRRMAAATLKAEGELSRAQLKELVAEAVDDERQLDVALALDRVVGDYRRRRAGVENDWAQFGSIATLELEAIEAPALIVHGTADADVPPDHGEHAAAAIPGAEYLRMSSGTHLCLFIHPDAAVAQARVRARLRAGKAG
jgi:pimeloyl-ACP methyl ester carboxylesterase